MIVKISSERQVTLPKQALDVLGVEPGDQLEIETGHDGFVLRPWSNDESGLDELDEKSTTDTEYPNAGTGEQSGLEGRRRGIGTRSMAMTASNIHFPNCPHFS